MAFHPREGWLGDGMRRRRPGMSRRDFLRYLGAGAGASLAAGGLGSLLEEAAASAAASPIPLPRQNNPVTWPVKGTPIASGLQPEHGATLKVYNWVAYINQKCLNAFAKKYKCKVELTTFNTISEGMSKVRSGQFDFDVFVPTVDVLGQLVEAALVRPLNHSYITNISQAWPQYQNPFYDQKWQYTVPYTIYSTGMAWRKDKVHLNPNTMANGYQMPWLAKKYKGKVAVLDDYRETLGLGLMKNNIYDLNTTSPRLINLAANSLLQLNHLVNTHYDNNDYSNVPSGQIWVHHAWSGDMAAAESYMPKGVPVEVVGYWFPKNGKGPVANDTMAILGSGKNPVLAHLFLNYMLDLPNVLENISFNGYMQPLTAVTPQKLVSEGLLPPSLISTAVLPSYFDKGIFEMELPPAVDAAWQQAYLRVSGGI
jgi:spermidine/putrescine transport system substrate-binding protein